MQWDGENRKASTCLGIPAERCLAAPSPARLVFPREEEGLVHTRVGLDTFGPKVWDGGPFWGVSGERRGPGSRPSCQAQSWGTSAGSITRGRVCAEGAAGFGPCESEQPARAADPRCL